MNTKMKKIKSSTMIVLLLLIMIQQEGAVVSAKNVTTFKINWDILNGTSDDYRSAEVGDTVEFILSSTDAIFLHPNIPGECNISAFVELPTTGYTFTEEDVYTEVVFASNITDSCEAQETVTFSVSPIASDRPTTCDEFGDSMNQCLVDAGVRTPGRLSCETCVAATIVRGLGTRACLGPDDDICKAFVGCPCGECAFEATAYGTCNIDSGRDDGCPITDCSDQVGDASGAFSIDKGSSFFLSLLGFVSMFIMLWFTN